MLLVLAACRSPGDAPGKAIALPSDEPPLPAGPGKQAFDDACRMCHSTRYVTDQPRLSRATWAAEVEKMRSVFGAPFPPERAPEIVEYLMSVNGDGK